MDIINITYKCYFMCKLHNFIYLSLIILGLLYVTFGILRAIYDGSNTPAMIAINQASVYAVVTALFIETVVTISLLIIYLRSIHQIAFEETQEKLQKT